MSRENEEWRPVKGFEGLYEVSDWGRVRSLNYKKTGKMKIIKNNKQKTGYIKNYLCRNGKDTNQYQHILVAEAFIPIPDCLKKFIGTRNIQVNHKDENKSNNNVDNLEWCTSKYNINYGTGKKRRKEKLKNGKTSKKVYQYTLSGELVKIWESTMECDRNGYRFGAVANCCRGTKHYHTYKGYRWSYEPL